MRNILLMTILVAGHSSYGLACDYTNLRPDPDADNCAGFLICAGGFEFPTPCENAGEYFDYADQMCREGTPPVDCNVLPASAAPENTATSICSQRCATEDEVRMFEGLPFDIGNSLSSV